MQRYLLFVGLVILLSSLNTVAQKGGGITDRGLVVYKLGNDTTTIQYFEFGNRKYKTTILTLTGQLMKYEGDGELDATGDIKEVRSRIFRPDSMNRWQLTGEAVNTFNGDSSIYTVTSNGKTVSRRAVPGKGIVSNAADACSFFVFPYMGFFAPRNIGDTTFHCQLSFGECRTYHVARLANEELKIGSSVMGRIRLFVDKNARMTGANAVGSSLNFIATVERQPKDYYEYIDGLAKRRFVSASFAPRTFRDTTRAVMQNKKIEIDYWRPYTRGRQIFGTVVPWNRIWRTGANNATQLRSEVVLVADGKKLPAGKYSLWTYPTEDGWQLVINKKADVWGTEYDAAADIMKMPLTVEKTTQKTDVLKISLIPLSVSKLRYQLEWDDYKVWTDFDIE